MLDRYGVKYSMQSPEIMAKSKRTMKEKYGVEHALQNDKIMEKAMFTRNKNKCYASRPQRKVGYKLLDIYHNCLLESLCGKYSLDCVVEINGIKVDVEYDGWYYHQNRITEDSERNQYVINHGYKILRIFGNESNSVPTIQELKDNIDNLITNPNLFIIYIDTRKNK